jgi:hypothetical protein
MLAFYLILHIRFLNGSRGAHAAEWAQEHGETGCVQKLRKNTTK